MNGGGVDLVERVRAALHALGACDCDECVGALIARIGLEEESREGIWTVPRGVRWRETRYVTPWVHVDDPSEAE